MNIFITDIMNGHSSGNIVKQVFDSKNITATSSYSAKWAALNAVYQAGSFNGSTLSTEEREKLNTAMAKDDPYEGC